MQKYGGFCWAGLLTFFFGTSPPATAEPIVVQARFVRENGRPLGGADVRLVVGSESNSRSPAAGKVLKTDAAGRIRYETQTSIKRRSVKLDSVFARHPSQLIEIGIELDLLGRRALYWIELDLLKAGARAGMSTYIAGKSGDFDLPLIFHRATHSWTFPDQPDGMHLTGTGLRLVEHDLNRLPTGVWTVHLVLEKQEFTVR